jgi:hypothetical protein
MRLSRLLTKYSTDAANIQESNSVNHQSNYMQRFGRYERTPEIRNSGKKSATNPKRWLIIDI